MVEADGLAKPELLSGAPELENVWNGNTSKLLDFKALVESADREALQNEGRVSETLIEKLNATFQHLCVEMCSVLGESSDFSEEAKRSLGLQFRQEVLPYLLLAKTAERWYSQPRGYAGDFMTIEQVYDGRPQGIGRIGAILDRCFLDLPAAHAVKNRRGLLAEEIQTTLSSKATGETAQVMSLASGPAREIFDVFEQLDNPSKLYVSLVDIDLQALAFVNDKAKRTRWRKRLRYVPGNLIQVVNGKQHLDVEPQDLIYSIGLIDYFSDKFVVRLLDYIYGKLSPGGRVILGNFHPSNPTRALMDHVLGWKLVHRTEEQMHRLFEQSAFQRPCTKIRYEEQRINLFAECVK